MLLHYTLEDRSSRLEDVLAHGLDEPASLEALGELPLCGSEDPEAAHYHQVFDYARAYPVGAAPHELVLESHHLVADGGLGLALPTRHSIPAPPRWSGCGNDEGRCRTAPLCPYRGDAVTGPGSAGRPRAFTEEAAEM